MLKFHFNVLHVCHAEYLCKYLRNVTEFHSTEPSYKKQLLQGSEVLNLSVLHTTPTSKDIWGIVFCSFPLWKNLMNQERAKEGNTFIQGIDAHSSFVSWYFQKATCFKVSDNCEIVGEHWEEMCVLWSMFVLMGNWVFQSSLRPLMSILDFKKAKSNVFKFLKINILLFLFSNVSSQTIEAKCWCLIIAINFNCKCTFPDEK